MPESIEKAAASKARKPGHEDRRAWVRFASERQGTCQPVALPTATQPENQWGAKVRDISTGGVCLFLRRRFEPGTPLVVEFPDVTGNTFTVTVLVRRVSASSDGWLIGCELDSALSEEVLEALR